MLIETPKLLAKYLNVPENDFQREMSPQHDRVADLVLYDKTRVFLIYFKSPNAFELAYRLALDAQKKSLPLKKNQIQLLVVPFMGGGTKKFCEKYGINWLDLSGNVRIRIPGHNIQIEGKANRFKVVGRPSDVFAPNSSRIARQLLLQQGEKIAQRRLSQLANVDEGFTSRIIRKLLISGVVAKDSEGKLFVPNRALLLNSWHEAYDFNKHAILKGHIAARSGEELLYKFTKLMKPVNMKYAATGLGAAWLYDHFADFRIVTYYLEERPNEEFLKEIDFREGEQGANIWLVVPNDKGVFQGSKKIEGIMCVHPIQVYLDLKGHPERSSEAAESLQKHFLEWSLNER